MATPHTRGGPTAPSCLVGWDMRADMRRWKKSEIVNIGEMQNVSSLNKSVEAFINLSPSCRKRLSCE